MITGQSPFGGEDEEELFDPTCNLLKISRTEYTINFLDKVYKTIVHVHTIVWNSHHAVYNYYCDDSVCVCLELKEKGGEMGFVR